MALTSIISFIALIVNSIIQAIIEFAAKMVRMDTYTDQQCDQLITTVINQSISLGFFSVFAPIIAKLPLLADLSESDSSAFPLVMLTTIIMQSFVSITSAFLLEITEIKKGVDRCLNEIGLTFSTQTQANRNYSGSEVPFVTGYAHLVKIVWFGFLYAVISPICLLVAAAGIFYFYITERLLFHYRYSIPRYGGVKLSHNLLDMIDLVPLLVGLFNFLIYTTTQKDNNFVNDQRIVWVCIANVGLGLAFAFFPSRLVIQHIYDRRIPNKKQ